MKKWSTFLYYKDKQSPGCSVKATWFLPSSSKDYLGGLVAALPHGPKLSAAMSGWRHPSKLLGEIHTHCPGRTEGQKLIKFSKSYPFSSCSISKPTAS